MDPEDYAQDDTSQREWANEEYHASDYGVTGADPGESWSETWQDFWGDDGQPEDGGGPEASMLWSGSDPNAEGAAPLETDMDDAPSGKWDSGPEGTSLWSGSDPNLPGAAPLPSNQGDWAGTIASLVEVINQALKAKLPGQEPVVMPPSSAPETGYGDQQMTGTYVPATYQPGMNGQPMSFTAKPASDETSQLVSRGGRWYDSESGKEIRAGYLVPDLDLLENPVRSVNASNVVAKSADSTGNSFSQRDGWSSGTGLSKAIADNGQTGWSAWEHDFRQNNGIPPTDQDRRDRIFSLFFAGSGEGGTWTPDDWITYYADRDKFWKNDLPWRDAPPPSLDRFVQHVETLASQYALDEKEKFVEAMGLVWSSFPTGSGFNALELALPGRALAMDERMRMLREGNAGWRPELVDDENPSHHFVAHFFVGFFFGSGASRFGAAIRDLPDDPADVRLGNMGADMGAAFANWGGDWRQRIGQYLKECLGEKRKRNPYSDSAK